LPDFHRNYLESLISKSVTAEDELEFSPFLGLQLIAAFRAITNANRLSDQAIKRSGHPF
jgi:hypothetical protein